MPVVEVKFFYGMAMDKLNGEAADIGCNWQARRFQLNNKSYLIGGQEFKQEKSTWQQYRVNPIQSHPLQPVVWRSSISYPIKKNWD
jgi:hypothetical protein